MVRYGVGLVENYWFFYKMYVGVLDGYAKKNLFY